jgi:hypothetical protein
MGAEARFVLVNLFIYLSLLCTSGECISKIDRKSADRTPENGEEVEGEDAHFNQLEEDSTQPLSSEATGSLFEVPRGNI